MVSGGFDLNMLVLDFPRADRCSDADWWPTVRAFEAALKANSARGAIVASMAENLPEDDASDLTSRGIVPLHGIDEAMDAAEAAAFIGEAWGRPIAKPLCAAWILKALPHRFASRTTSPPARGRGTEPIGAAASVISGSSPPPSGGEVARAQPETVRGSFALDEACAESLLAEAGLPVPAGHRAATPDRVVAAAEFLGFPVALKALGVAHKSELGAVRLNLHDSVSVHAAATELAPLGSGLFVEKMIAGGVAELIVGITRDPLFGPVMTIGSGGVLVELLKDSATLLLPASREEVEAALRSLKMFPLLTGYRGRPKADLASAIEAILGIADFATRNAGWLEEFDINPLIVCAEGEAAWIADALMVVREVSLPFEGRVRPEAGGGVAAAERDIPHPSRSARHPALKGEGNAVAQGET
jgi:hypothetical protein